MRLQLIIPVAVFISVALMGLIKMRKTELEKEEKRNRFQSTKLRVTNDVLKEYESDKAETQKKVDKLTIDAKALEEEGNKLKLKSDEAKAKVDICEGNKKSGVDEAAKAETQHNGVKAETDKEKEKWKKEVETLKQTLNARSPVCDYLKKESQAGSKLCSVEEPKKEEPKKEEPKKEEPKVEEPKKEEPKKEEPKKEEPKKEEPKKEEPKKEEPKKEEPKKEEPKKEEPKKEAPKK